MKNIKEKTVWIWQNLENILIVLFFLTFTFNIRKVFLTPYSFLNGGFNEYMTMSLSWADALMIAVIFIYTIKYINSQIEKGDGTNSFLYILIRFLSSVIRVCYGKIVSYETFFLLIFLGWVGLSIFWSQYQSVAVYRFLTLVEIALFAFIAVKSLKKPNWLKISLLAVIFNGLFQSILGIAQFVHNGSLGIRVFGESILGPNIDGVAKIIIDGEKHIRAYGTIPHPNILAGFLMVLLFLILTELFLRTVGAGLAPALKFLDRHEVCPYSLNSQIPLSNIVSCETILGFLPVWFLRISGSIIGLGFVLTFSRSAFLGLFVGLFIFLLMNYFSSCHCEEPSDEAILSDNGKTRLLRYARNDNAKADKFEYICPIATRNSYKVLIIYSIFLVLIMIVLLKHTSFFSNQSLQERNLYKNVSHETILSHPVGGVGIGQTVINPYYGHSNLESWQYQPVHNIYLLIFGELGFVGFVLFLLFLISLFWNVKQCRNKTVLRLTKSVLRCIILSFLVISFFDHYFWDIKIGTLVFVLPVILFVVKKN